MNRKLFLITFLITLVMLIGVMVVSIYSYYNFHEESSDIIRRHQALSELHELASDLQQYQYYLALGDTLDPGLVIPRSHEQKLDSLSEIHSITRGRADSLKNELAFLRDNWEHRGLLEQTLESSDELLDRLISSTNKQLTGERNARETSGQLTPGTLVVLCLITLAIITYIFVHTLVLLRKVDQLNGVLAEKNEQLRLEFDELHSLQQLVNSVLESSLNGIIYFESIRDSEGVIVDFNTLVVNQSAADMIGIPREKILDSTLLEFNPGNKEAGIFDQYVKVVESGISHRFIQKYELDNINGWFDISAVKSDDGFVVTFTDISEAITRQERLKLQQDELTRSREKYLSLFERSADAIFTLDADFRFTEVSPSTARIFNIPRESLIGSDFTLLFHSRNEWDAALPELSLSGALAIREMEFVRESGNEFPGDLSLIKFEDEAGKAGYQGIIRDITIQKKAADEIQLAERLALTGRIARSIAHEVRNPLTNLKLALEQLTDEIDKNEDTEMLTGIIERNATRIDALINELLSSSKADSLNRNPDDIRRIIEEAIQLIRDRILLKGMKVTSRYDENIPEVNIESDQIRRAVLNIMVNAVEAMEENEGILSIAVAHDTDWVTITIQDNGAGIEKEELRKLFDPFYTNKRNGMGLGLTTVHTIIKNHGGKIEVDSSVGEGTLFTIMLPLT